VLQEFLAGQALEERAEDWMRRLIVSEFVTLDGVMEAPGHDQHRDGKNAWALRYAGADQQRYKAEELLEAGGILLGRVTYEIFAAFWPTAPKDEGFADRMNSIPKYVISESLRTAGWQNSSVIGGNLADKIAELKRQSGGDILLRQRRPAQLAHQRRPDRRVPAHGVSGGAWKWQAAVPGHDRRHALGARRHQDL
jgi:dihydrofolate reductase